MTRSDMLEQLRLACEVVHDMLGVDELHQFHGPLVPALGHHVIWRLWLVRSLPVLDVVMVGELLYSFKGV